MPSATFPDGIAVHLQAASTTAPRAAAGKANTAPAASSIKKGAYMNICKQLGFVGMFFSNRVINIGRHTLLKMIIGVQFLRRGVVFAFGRDAARVNSLFVEFDCFKLKLFQLGDIVRPVGIVAQAKAVGTEILAAGRFEFDKQGLVGIARGILNYLGRACPARRSKCPSASPNLQD